MGIFLHTGFAPWAAGTGAAQLTEKGMLERSCTCCRHGGDAPHQHKGGQFWQLEVIVGGRGPGRVPWLRLSSPTFSVGAALPLCPGKEGESALQRRWEQPAGITPWLQGQSGAGSAGVRDAALRSLPVVLYPVSPSSLPCYPLLLLKAEGVSSPEFPPLLQ